MPYASTRDLKEDVLFRASEPLTGSAWNSKVIDYLNRVYNQLASGASEFTPEFVEDWWWMRSSAAITLVPSYKTGTVAVTQDNATITFSSAPAISLAGRRIRVTGHPDLFIISSHTAASVSATLDTPYTGLSSTAVAFQALQTDYTLAADVAALVSPMIAYRTPLRIRGMTPEALDITYPLGNLKEGLPVAFALTNEQTVRFSHGGRSDGMSIRVDYRYRPTVTALADLTTSFPLVPLAWRHVLADMALVYLLLDKNDKRATDAATQTRLVTAAMFKENRRRLVKVDQLLAYIKPRLGTPRTDPLRTASGLIIG